MKQFKDFLRLYLWVLIDLVFPRHCRICSRVILHEDRTYLCPFCFQNIRFLPESTCIRCSKILTVVTEERKAGDKGMICSSCIGKRYDYDSCYAVCTYEGPVKELIHRFKFHQEEFLAKTLQKIFMNGPFLRIDWGKYDWVVPVPLHPRKLKERGFNQSEILAQTIKKFRLGKLCKKNLVRIKYSSGQTLQDRKSRIENIYASFQVKNPEQIKNKSILLVDDVLTTGATLEECSRILKEAGARNVTALVLARSI